MSDKNRKDSAKVGKENTITFYSCPKVQILGKVERFGGKVKIKRRTAKTPVSVFALKLTLSRVTEGERERPSKRECWKAGPGLIFGKYLTGET